MLHRTRFDRAAAKGAGPDVDAFRHPEADAQRAASELPASDLFKVICAAEQPQQLFTFHKVEGRAHRAPVETGHQPVLAEGVEQVHHPEEREVPAAIEMRSAEIVVGAVAVERPLFLAGEEVIIHRRLERLAPAPRQRGPPSPPPMYRYTRPRR